MMHSKSQIVHMAAAKLGVPVIDIKLAVPNQIEGKPMIDLSIKKAYNLRTKTGILVATFDSIELMEAFQEARVAKHGPNAPLLYPSKVTTIEEPIYE